jgi:uncharacterized SAM-binding protein YcdF (DUF218 family)
LIFVAVKVVSLVVSPTALLVEMAFVGWLLGRRRWSGRVLLALGVIGLMACLVLPVEGWSIRPLEDRFPAVTVPPAHVDGIVVLGGSIDDLTSLDRGMPTLNAAANRLTSFVALARQYPQARLVFTGGSGAIEQGITTEAQYARTLFEQLGLPADRVVFENASRTTWENAVDTHAIVQPKPGETWVLLTSASHMPRAVGAFRAAGWTVLPWPVGYRSRDWVWGFETSLGTRLSVLDTAGHEWEGLLAYWLRGHSSALFPAPAAGEAAAS